MDDENYGFDDSLVNGDGTPADTVQATGGSNSPYVTNQTPYDVSDNGQLSSNASNNGQSGSSTSSTPGWLNTLQSLSGAASNAAQQLGPIINGKPAQNTPPATSSTSTTLLLILAASGFLCLVTGGFRQ